MVRATFSSSTQSDALSLPLVALDVGKLSNRGLEKNPRNEN